MSNKEPRTILTNQSEAMVKAILIVMTKTQHRHCLWHISLNVMKQISSAYTLQFKRRFKAAILGPKNNEEFNLTWDVLLK